MRKQPNHYYDQIATKKIDGTLNAGQLPPDVIDVLYQYFYVPADDKLKESIQANTGNWLSDTLAKDEAYTNYKDNNEGKTPLDYLTSIGATEAAMLAQLTTLAQMATQESDQDHNNPFSLADQQMIQAIIGYTEDRSNGLYPDKVYPKRRKAPLFTEHRRKQAAMSKLARSYKNLDPESVKKLEKMGGTQLLSNLKERDPDRYENSIKGFVGFTMDPIPTLKKQFHQFKGVGRFFEGAMLGYVDKKKEWDPKTPAEERKTLESLHA